MQETRRSVAERKVRTAVSEFAKAAFHHDMVLVVQRGREFDRVLEEFVGAVETDFGEDLLTRIDLEMEERDVD